MKAAPGNTAKASGIDIGNLASELFGLDVSVEPMSGEQDINFKLRDNSGCEFVLKLSHPSQDLELIRLQNKALHFLEAERTGLLHSLRLPRIIPSRRGRKIEKIRAGDCSYLVRLLTYLPGRPAALVRPHSPEMLFELGRILGSLDSRLSEMSCPDSADREFLWDLRQGAGVIANYLEYVKDPEKRSLVERIRKTCLPILAERKENLRSGLIHNDANDYNIMVTSSFPGDVRISGLIDFGDLAYSWIVSEPAIAAAYMMMGKADPVGAASSLAAGYDSVYPLTDDELAVLFPLSCLRAAVSVCLSAYRSLEDPENKYLTISETPAWKLLEQAAGIHPRLAEYRIRGACGREPCPLGSTLAQWLKENSGKLVSPVPVDLGDGSRAVLNLHNEARLDPSGFRFSRDDSSLREKRNIHLGTDIFLEPGTPVLAPLEGIVYSCSDNSEPLNHGPTVILRHLAEQGTEFFTLYGHLQRFSPGSIKEGMKVDPGQQIGRVGDSKENGGCPPHLHFQIIADMLGRKSNFPGAATPSQRKVWCSISPNPNLMLGIPEEISGNRGRSVTQIAAFRGRHMGKSLSISYRKPLKIVKGSGQYLYDHEGRQYLDCVNNVCHVGHSHPAVARAGMEQSLILNTNTRYLHDGLVDYLEALLSHFPEPLDTCFLVCSGSEANELALRLAYAHTGARDVIAVRGAYHGNTQTLVDISSYKHDGPGGKGAPGWVHVVPLPDGYRGEYKGLGSETGAAYAGMVTEELDRMAERGTWPAAFICESLPGCGGQIVLPDGYLENVYSSVRKYGGVNIADEVQTGFGRVGSHFWGFELQEVVPDIVTLGKPIGNGHPIGAVVTTSEIAASFSNGMEYFNTFGGNPVSCAIGKAVLDVIEQEGLQSHACQTGEYLLARLAALKEKHPVIGDVRGKGLFLGLELVRDRVSLEPAPADADYIVNRLRELGFLLSTDGPFHNVLKIKPPLPFTVSNADQLADALDGIFDELRSQGWQAGGEPGSL